MTDAMDATRDDSAWSAARRTAAEQRQNRLHPPAWQQWADRWLRPVVWVVWLGSTFTAVLAFTTPGHLHDTFRLISGAALIAVLGLGIWGLAASRRYLLSGSAASIRANVPDIAWPALRRQLDGRQPIDPDRTDIVLELAYQQGRLATGQAPSWPSTSRSCSTRLPDTTTGSPPPSPAPQ